MHKFRTECSPIHLLIAATEVMRAEMPSIVRRDVVDESKEVIHGCATEWEVDPTRAAMTILAAVMSDPKRFAAEFENSPFVCLIAASEVMHEAMPSIVRREAIDESKEAIHQYAAEWGISLMQAAGMLLARVVTGAKPLAIAEQVWTGRTRP